MNIRKVRWIAVTAFVLFVLGNLASTRWYIREFSLFTDSQHRLAEASKNITLLLDLQQKALMNPAPEVAQQWRVVHTDLLQALRSLNTSFLLDQDPNKSVPKLIALAEALEIQFQETYRRNTAVDPEEDRLRREVVYDSAKDVVHQINEDVYSFAETIVNKRDAQTKLQINKEWTFSISQLVLVFLGMLYVNTRIIRPVERITRAAEQVESGNTDARSALQSNDEVGLLSRRFDAMTDALQKRQISLEKAQSETQLLYRTLNQHSIISIADRHGNIIHANDAFCEISGYSREELLGQDHRIVNSGVQSNAFWEDFWRAINAGKPWRGEICNRAKNGELYWVDSVVAPITMVDGKVEKIISIRNDISYRKKMELALRQSNDLLESRVSQRTQELENALRIAEAADRSRRDFLANTTHELRTPMNSVLGMTYLALKGNIDPVQRDYLEKIRISGFYLTRIIDDILDFSKMDAGKMELVPSPFHIGTVVDFIVRQSEVSAGNKGLSIRATVDEQLSSSLWGDGMRIGQVLLNYVSNAIKFSKSGDIYIRALYKGQDADGIGIRFEVEDSGIGIEPSQIERLFSPFEQVDASITRKFGGTGLGLAISRQLATLMKGEVGVSSVPGQGSTFWMELKLQVSDDANSDIDSVPDMAELLEKLRGSSILVVDDNEFNLEVARGILEDVGVQVETATNGLEAIDALRKNPFDCVLMDVQMPVLDGLGAARQIRSDPVLANTLIIGLTANASGADKDRCLQSGMSDLIKKPIDPEQMFLTLVHWLQIESPNAQSAGATHEPPEPAAHSVSAAPHAPRVDDVLWDPQALQKLVGDNQTTRARLLKKFIATGTETVQAVASAVHEECWSDAAGAAHKLKSSARAVGAMQLGSLCEALERGAKASDAVQSRHLAEQIAQVFESLRSLIEADLGGA